MPHYVTWGTCLVILISVGCATVSPPSPQSTVGPRGEVPAIGAVLTVDDAVVHALAYDPDIRAARHLVSAEYWRTVQASLPGNPSLIASSDPTEWQLKLSTYLANLLDLGGHRSARIEAGRSREEQAALEVFRREIELTRQVRSDYAEVCIRIRKAEIIRKRIELIGEALAVARMQRELGDLSERELLWLERDLQKEGMALRDQTILRKQAEARLNRTLGRPLSSDLHLEMIEDRPEWVQESLPEETSIDLGSLQRPELAILAAQAGEHRAMLRMSRVQWIQGIEGGPYLKGDGGSTFGGVEVEIVVPIFDRGQAERSVRESLLAALEERMLATQATLLLDVHEALLRLRHARLRHRTDLPAIYRTLLAEHDLLGEAKRLGEASEAEVRTARLAVLETEMEIEKARLMELLAHADLAAAIGDRGRTTQGVGAYGKH